MWTADFKDGWQAFWGHWFKQAVVFLHGRSLAEKGPNDSLRRLDPFMDLAPVNEMVAALVNEVVKVEAEEGGMVVVVAV